MKYLTNTGITRFWNNIKSYITSKIPTKVSELDNDLEFLTSVPDHDASKITSGTIDIARLPQGALERLAIVADESARFALTSSNVQVGDVVKQSDTGVMYMVVDESNLNNSAGYVEFTAGTATSVPWSGVTGKPSDFNPSSHTHGNISNDGKLGTASRVVITDSNKAVDVSSVTSTELGYLSGVTSSLQTQINSKSDDSSVVHTTGNESISGTKSFNSDLNLNYAVTDVDDIVDSIPGTGNSDDYVHLTGNETVNGVKSFPDGIVANVSGSCSRDGDGNTISSTYGKLAGTQTWTGDNSFNSDLNLNYINADVSDIVDSIPGLGTTEDYVHLTGSESVNGVKSFPDGIVANVSGNCTKDGDGNTISSTYGKLASNQTWSGENTTHNIKPEVNATYNLGNASYRWASVYANNYYYGTTSFTDKFVTTDTNQVVSAWKRFKQVRFSSDATVDITQTSYQSPINVGAFNFVDNNIKWWGDIEVKVNTDATSEMTFYLSNWKTNGTQGVYGLHYTYSKDFNTVNFHGGNGVVNLGTPTNKWKSVYADSYYYGTTPFTDKFVTTDTVQTITSSKTFTTAQYSKSAFRFANDNYTSGTPSSDVFYQSLLWGGYVNNAYTSSASINTAIRSNGYSDLSFRVYSQTSNDLSGVVAETNADASVIAFRPIVNSTHNLGASSYRWKSVYSDSYYYGTTEWGLDKANVWAARQRITGNNINTRGILSIYNSAHTKGSTTPSASDMSIGTIFLGDSGNGGLVNSLGFVSCDLANSGNMTMLSLSAVRNEASSTERANLVVQYDKSDNTNPEKIVCKGTILPQYDSTYNLGTSANKWKSVYANSYYLGTTAFGNIVTHNTSEFATASHTHGNSDITSLDASKITSGTIDIARLPQGALDRLITVADQTARYALTSNDVSLGDTVKQLDTGELYIVTDITNLNNANGYTIYTAGTVTRAYADEDGINIKTGYGKLAGTQTWSSTNTFTSTIICKDPSSTNTYGVGIYFRDYQNNRYGYIQPHTNNIVIGADNGNIQFNSSLVPYNNGTLSIGASSYRWSGVYADSYYYGTTEWGLDKSNVWTGTQTIEQSTFAQLRLKNSTISLGDAIPSSQKTVGSVVFAGSDNSNMGFMDFRDSALGNTFIRILARQKYDANGNRSTSGTIYVSGLDIGVLNNKTPCVVPTSNAAAQLGTSTSKWKSFNGLNPGALSFPSSSYVEIDTTNWNLTGADNPYIPTEDGYLLCVSNTCTDVKIFDFTTRIGATSHSSTSKENYAYIPVHKNDNCIVGFVGTNPVLRFYPCLGNV